MAHSSYERITFSYAFHPLSVNFLPRLVTVTNPGISVFAVGTTVVRSLESAACDDGKLNSVFSDTSLFIKPGYSWKVVDKLVTNFHLPQTSLLLLVSSFATPDLILKAYRHAIEEEYSFTA